MRRSLGILAIALPLAAGAGQAADQATSTKVQQQPPAGRGRAGVPPAGRGQLPARGRAGLPLQNGEAQPAVNLQQIRRKLAARAQRELNLSNDQMVKLQQVDMRFERRQRDLDIVENQTRGELRRAIVESPNPDQDKRVGQLLDKLFGMQRQRFDAIDDEQKELGGFLTNVQRARWHALQENVRRQVELAKGPPRDSLPPDRKIPPADR